MTRASASVERDAPAPERDERGTFEDHPVRAENVSKIFGDQAVVDDVSLSIRRGEVFGLIGPSGSGKSTLLKLMVGQSLPTSGSLHVLGVEPRNFGTREREAIGYVPQQFLLYPSLTVEQNAKFAAGLYGIGWLRRKARIRETLQLLELWEARGRLARDISGGMKRRLVLGCGLLHEPELLFVDEPTAGLDPLLRTKIWDHLRELGAGGTTVLVTTQFLDEAALCDRVAFLGEGRMVALDTPDALRKRAIGGDALDIDTPHFQQADADALYELPGVRRISAVNLGRVRVIVDDASTAMEPVSSVLRERGVEVTAIRAHEPTFDEVFIALADSGEGNGR